MRIQVKSASNLHRRGWCCVCDICSFSMLIKCILMVIFKWKYFIIYQYLYENFIFGRLSYLLSFFFLFSSTLTHTSIHSYTGRPHHTKPISPTRFKWYFWTQTTCYYKHFFFSLIFEIYSTRFSIPSTKPSLLPISISVSVFSLWKSKKKTLSEKKKINQV